MVVKVKLFTVIKDGKQKEVDCKLEEKATVRDVLSLLELEGQDIAIIVINGKDASKDSHLQDGDVVSIFPPLGGG